MIRGLRDILLAFGTATINQYRRSLATVVKRAVKTHRRELFARGWNLEFVLGPMAKLAASSIMEGGGKSPDMVRVVVAIVEILCFGERSIRRLYNEKSDHTLFWSRSITSPYVSIADLDIETNLDAMVALTRFFVIEWSTNLDRQLFHALPKELLMK